jgi:hypothetical protein
MKKNTFFFLILSVIAALPAKGQEIVKTEDLFRRDDQTSGVLKINQDAAVDTLIGRYILMSNRVYRENGYYGIEGYRIQIYSSSNRNAREESKKAQAQFISSFPDIFSTIKYSEPGYFKVRVGDFRTKAEATRLYMEISRVFPDAYLVPDVINFPELTIRFGVIYYG